MIYKISLSGCDDSTHFFMALEPEAAQTLETASELANQHSFYGCMPTMSIEKAEDQTTPPDQQNFKIREEDYHTDEYEAKENREATK